MFYTQDFEFTPRFFDLHPWFWVYTKVFRFTPRILILHPGFLFYTQDFCFTPRFFDLHPWFWVYTQVFCFTPRTFSLHLFTPIILVYTQDFQLALVYTQVFWFKPGIFSLHWFTPWIFSLHPFTPRVGVSLRILRWQTVFSNSFNWGVEKRLGPMVPFSRWKIRETEKKGGEKPRFTPLHSV